MQVQAHVNAKLPYLSFQSELTHLKKIPPRPLNHVAVSVAHIEPFVDWYSRILGFQQMGDIMHIKRSETPDAAIFRIYPASLNEYKIAYMATGNGASLEVIEFIDPRPVPQAKFFQYNLEGFFHICVTDPDPACLAREVVESGGQMIGQMINTGGIECVYVTDPWCNVVEILNISFERLATQLSA
ncbi:hypothetical protein N7471_013607 [Penicillium samsonianum]|uniref:uncharacterized protein n=1 Tax=Penicillium samsonianum TaxID=1882272 RepID=UPI0025492FC2|nr:uncharacterized protein N7471_013607 [Penicillium samsonianum]KAJ6118987.1 hypothetical protein N7471_013607 [Penicillium samsonianum]